MMEPPRSGLFLPLSLPELSQILGMVSRAGYRPDAGGVAAYLTAQAKKPARVLPRLASDAVAFARENPQIVATAANVARVLLKR